MKNSKSKYLTGFIVAIFAFLFGWQSANIYISNFGPRMDLANTTVSPATAFTPIIESLMSEGIDLSLFWRVRQTLDDRYLNEEVLDDEEMIYGSVKGMVSALDDPYTVFLPPKETKEFKDSLNGSLEGIGAELTIKDYNLVIVSPLKDSPAEKAGLRPNDIIYKIDGNIASEMTLYEAVTSIRGEVGTQVTLTIIRENIEKPFDIIITRKHIDIESVSLEEKPGSIFVLSVNQFSDDTKTELIENISKILLKEPKGLILDLRFNGGGYLDIAVDILSEFLAGKKEAVTIKKRDERDSEKIFVYGTPRLPDLPLVVLINGGSASASEIVAGAIQDHGRGVVMGEQSFGKSTVQEVETYSDGSSLRLTVAEWFTPAGRSIHEVGISPDIIVEIDEEKYFVDGYDPQMDRAVQYLSSL
ncbi:MAG: S41 family peptidase [Patescibacteria group bacterium]|nr:S41 family peptidase [Patescibacteria group bacterium]